MIFTSRELGYAIVLTTVLLAIILLAVAVYQFFLEPVRKRRRVDLRLNDGGEYLRRAQILKERSGDKETWGLRLLKSIGGARLLDRVQTLMLQADIYQDPGRFWNRILIIILVASLAGFWFFRSALVALLIAAVLAVLPFLYLARKKAGKTRRFEQQMPDAMELLARSLRAGHTLPSAVELLGEEMGDPMGTEMKIAYEEQNFGLSVTETLLNMMRRVDSMDLRYFVSALLIQQETGGNLAELMENIARVVRNRLNFKGKVRALAASGRISAFIMIFTPIFTFLIMLVVVPSYEKILLVSATGKKMLMLGLVDAAIGAYLLRRMIKSLGT